MNPNDIGGWIIGIILIIVFILYFYFTNPWRDAKADAAAGAAMVGGAYLLRKYMKNKKSHKKRK